MPRPTAGVVTIEQPEPAVVAVADGWVPNSCSGSDCWVVKIVCVLRTGRPACHSQPSTRADRKRRSLLTHYWSAC